MYQHVLIVAIRHVTEKVGNARWFGLLIKPNIRVAEGRAESNYRRGAGTRGERDHKH